MKFLRDELRPMVRLAAPIVLAELGWMAMPIEDTMMVGRLPYSAQAIGAVSLGGIIFFAVAVFGVGLMLGLDTLVSQSYGAGEIEDCHRSLVNGVYLSLIAAPILMGVAWLLGLELGRAGVQPDVLVLTIPYLHVLNWGMLPLLLYFALRRYLQAINRPVPVMFALLSANLVNLVGDWALVYGHLGFRAMGPVGSSWSTLFAWMYMAAILVADSLYHDRHHPTRLREAARQPSLARIRRLTSLGVPAASQMTVEVAVFALATSLVARLGALPLSSHQIALNTVSFTYMVPLGISSAAAVRVGHALGRNDPHAAALSGWTAISLGAGFMACMAVLLMTAPRAIARLYSPDRAVIEAASQLLFVAAFFQLFDGIQTVATGALRGAGDTRTPLACHFIGYWLIGLPAGYYLCFHRGFGARGLWAGLSLALILIGIALLLLWRRQVRQFVASS